MAALTERQFKVLFVMEYMFYGAGAPYMDRAMAFEVEKAKKLADEEWARPGRGIIEALAEIDEIIVVAESEASEKLLRAEAERHNKASKKHGRTAE